MPPESSKLGPKKFSASDLLDQGKDRTSRGARKGDDPDAAVVSTSAASRRLDDPDSGKYERVTVYMTTEQQAWANAEAFKASSIDVRYNVSEVIRLAMDRLKYSMSGVDLGDALAEQAWAEAEAYPGRMKRKMPPRPARS